MEITYRYFAVFPFFGGIQENWESYFKCVEYFGCLPCNYSSLICEKLGFIYCHCLKKPRKIFQTDMKISEGYILLLLKFILGRNKGLKKAFLSYNLLLVLRLFSLLDKRSNKLFGSSKWRESSFILTRL